MKKVLKETKRLNREQGRGLTKTFAFGGIDLETPEQTLANQRQLQFKAQQDANKEYQGLNNLAQGLQIGASLVNSFGGNFAKDNGYLTGSGTDPNFLNNMANSKFGKSLQRNFAKGGQVEGDEDEDDEALSYKERHKIAEQKIAKIKEYQERLIEREEEELEKAKQLSIAEEERNRLPRMSKEEEELFKNKWDEIVEENTERDLYRKMLELDPNKRRRKGKNGWKKFYKDANYLHDEESLLTLYNKSDKIYDSFLRNNIFSVAGKTIDPTGVSSWGDVESSFNELKESGEMEEGLGEYAKNFGNLTLDVLSAIPALGFIPKIARAVRAGRAVVEAVDGAQDFAQSIFDYDGMQNVINDEGVVERNKKPWLPQVYAPEKYKIGDKIKHFKEMQTKYLNGKTREEKKEEEAIERFKKRHGIGEAVDHPVAPMNPIVLSPEEFEEQRRKFATPQYAKGGRVPVEVEGNEVGQTPDGRMMAFQGPAHEQGGIPVELPEGTKIYSDRVSVDGKTMAQRKRRRENIIKNLSKKASKGDMLAKNTLDRYMLTAQHEESLDMGIQQLLNNNSVSTPQSPGIEQNFGKGGILGAIGKGGAWAGKALWDASTWAGKGIGKGAAAAGKGIGKAASTAFGETGEVLKDGVNQTLRGVTNSFTDAMPTIGDALGIYSNLKGAYAGKNAVLENRAGDTPNINAFEHYGKEGLKTIDSSKRYARQIGEASRSDIEAQRRASMAQNRSSARSINTQRSLDLASQMQAGKLDMGTYAQEASQMQQILNSQAQMQNQRDQMVMQGEQARDLANREDRDKFNSNMLKANHDIWNAWGNTGKQLNSMQERSAKVKALNKIYHNFGMDKNGNLVQTSTTENPHITNYLELLNTPPQWLTDFYNGINGENIQVPYAPKNTAKTKTGK